MRVFKNILVFGKVLRFLEQKNVTFLEPFGNLLKTFWQIIRIEVLGDFVGLL